MSRLAYYQRQKLEPFYTELPTEYWDAEEIIDKPEYVLRKMGATELNGEVLETACEMYPEIFCWWKLGVRLRPYQHYAIDQMIKNPYTSLAWSRRLGKSTITKIFMLWTSVYNKLPGDLTGTTWNVILQDQEIANTLYIEPLHEMMEKGDKVVKRNFKGALGENYFTSMLVTRRDKYGKVRANQITFKTKTGICRINTMPPTNKAIGREGNLIGDEVSKWKENPKCKDEFVFYDKLIAIMKDNPAYKAVFLSTPEGDEDLFAKEIFDPDIVNTKCRYFKIWFAFWVRQEPKWLSEMEITREEAIAKGRLYMFQQEYEAKFMTISEPFFDLPRVRRAMKDNWRRMVDRQSPCSLGIDWGGSEKSETALTISSWDTKMDSPRKVIYMKTYEVGQDLIYLENDLNNLKLKYNIKWVTPDNKGGRWMMPRLEKLFGMGRVKPLNFTTDKVAGYELLRKGIHDGIIELPNDVKLLKQIANLNEKLKPASAKGKDDLIDSVMLSMYPLLNTTTTPFRIWRY